MTAPDFASSVDLLRAASHVAIHSVGFAAARPPEMVAYVQLRDAGAAVRTEVDELLRTGSPSGRVYAGLLLEALDPHAGHDAWASLAGDPAPTAIHPGGCLPFFPTTVGAFASAALASGSAASAMNVSGRPSWSHPEAGE